MALNVLIIPALTITKYLKHWFSAVGGVREPFGPPREHWAMSGNIFGLSQFEAGLLLACHG